MTPHIRRTDALDRVGLWLDAAESDLGLIEGAPGAGKSMLAGQIAETFRPVHFHRCDASDDTSISPLRFVAALARSIADELEPYAKALVEIARPDIVINATAHADVVEAGGSVRAVHIESITIADLPAREAFDRVVRLPLEACDLPPQRRLLVVIDGLDESLGYRHRDHLVDLLQHVTAGPAPIRFLVTARSGDARIADRLGASFLDIDRLDDGDIYRYAYDLLGNLTDDRRRLLATRIAEKRNFLYAYHVVADARGLPATADVAISVLPEGLTEVYRSFLARELAPDRRDRQWTRDIRPVLGLVACGRGRGVPREVIGAALGEPASRVDDALLTCGQFLRLEADGTGGELVGIYHGSFRDFLATDELYHVYEPEAHRSLSSHLYATVLPAGAGAGYAYALAHLPYHLAGAGLRAELIELAHRREFLAAQLRQLSGQPFADLDTVDAALIAAAEESRPLDVASFLLYIASRRATYAGSILDHLERYGPAQAMAGGAAYPEGARTVHDLVVAAWLILTDRPADARLVLESLLGRSPGYVTGIAEVLAALLLAIAAPAEHELALRLAVRLLDSVGMQYLAAHLWLLSERGLALTASAAVPDRSLRYRVLLAFRDDTMLDPDPADLDEIEQHIVESVDYRDTDPPPGHLWQIHPYLVLAVAMSLAGRGEAGDARLVLDEPLANATRGWGRDAVDLMLQAGEARTLHRRGDATAAAELLADAETRAAALTAAGARATVLLCLARTALTCGLGDEAIRLAGEAYAQIPELDYAAHEDAYHGPCVQGLILDAGLVLAGVGDLDGAVRAGERLLGYGSRDGVEVLLAVVVAATADGDADRARRTTELINEGLGRLDPTQRLLAGFRAASVAEPCGLPGFSSTRHEVLTRIEQALGARPAVTPLADAVVSARRVFAEITGSPDDLGRILREAPAEGVPAFGEFLEVLASRPDPEAAAPGRPGGGRAGELSRAAVVARGSGDLAGADRMRDEATKLLRADEERSVLGGGSAQAFLAQANTLFSRAETWARLGNVTAARETCHRAEGTLKNAELAWEAFQAISGFHMSLTDAARGTDSEWLTRLRHYIDIGVAFAEGGDQKVADDWFDAAVLAADRLRYPDLRSSAASYLCTRLIGIRRELAMQMLPSAVVGRPELIGRLLHELATAGDAFGETGTELLRQASQSGEAAVLALGALATSHPDSAQALWAIMSREMPFLIGGRQVAQTRA